MQHTTRIETAQNNRKEVVVDIRQEIRKCKRNPALRHETILHAPCCRKPNTPELNNLLISKAWTTRNSTVSLEYTMFTKGFQTRPNWFIIVTLMLFFSVYVRIPMQSSNPRVVIFFRSWGKDFSESGRSSSLPYAQIDGVRVALTRYTTLNLEVALRLSRLRISITR